MTTEPLADPPIADVVFRAALQARAIAGHGNSITVQGTSMWPMLQPDDLAMLDLRQHGFRPGEIVVYRSGERLMVHRVLSSRAGRLVTAGDSRPLIDATVPTEAILGRVVEVQTADGAVDLRSTTAQALGRRVGESIRTCT